MNGNNATRFIQHPHLYLFIIIVSMNHFCFRYDRTSMTPVMEQIDRPMNIVASSSVHVNSYGWGGGGLGSYPLAGVVAGSYVYLAGIYHEGIDLSKITQTAGKVRLL